MMDELLQRCAARDEEAVGTLLHLFQARALDLAGALLNDPDLAQDAVQEAFLSALQHLPELREPAAFPGWFHQLVRTQCSRLRRKSKEVPTDDPDPGAAADPSPREQLQQQELRVLVRKALAALSAAQRPAVEKFYLEGLSCLEISEELGVPLGTVKRRLHDGREQLRALILGYIPADAGLGAPSKPGSGLPF